MDIKKQKPIIDGTEDRVVDTVTTSGDFTKEINDAAFMEEIVTVYLHPSTDENQPPHVIVNVNGTNQPILRGHPTPIKRKYLEVLARMKETKYTQRVPNPSEPDRMVLEPRSAIVYPFDIQHDPNPKGRAWLNNILAEPA